jgi:predicted dehydrogenase
LIFEVCTPNYNHKDIIIEALNAGKHINCEKPLAMNLTEAKEILDTANAHPELVSQMCFEYRYLPPAMRAKQLIDKGFLGRIYSARVIYLHAGNSDKPSYVLKIQRNTAAAVHHMTLPPHIIDLTRFLLGDFERNFQNLKFL